MTPSTATTLRRRSDELAGELVTPPTARPGICGTCRAWSDTGTGTCRNCRDTRTVLGVPPVPVSMVSLYRRPSPLRDWLKAYKGTVEGDADPVAVDLDAGAAVQALLGRMLLQHGDRLTELLGGVDAVVVVPSTTRPPPHPLQELLAGLDVGVPVEQLLLRGTGTMTHRRPHPDGFRAVTDGAPRRLLLLDDIYTTGAHANSAAHALRGAGHEIAGLLVLARRVNPDYSAGDAEMWQDQTRREFDWETSPLLQVP